MTGRHKTQLGKNPKPHPAPSLVRPRCFGVMGVVTVHPPPPFNLLTRGKMAASEQRVRMSSRISPTTKVT